MKKIITIFLLVLLISLSSKTVRADHYLNFEDLNITKGKLIDDYSSSDLKKHYKEVDKRKFSGWRTKTINNRVKATFITETIFSYYNDGYTAIDYHYKSEESETTKYSFSTTGSIGLKMDKSAKGFKNGLDGSLKMSYSQDSNKTKKETYDVKMKIDPGTQVNLYYYGEGKLTNGVAAKYIFWIRLDRGGFEVFEVSTKYHRLEKVRIWKRLFPTFLFLYY